MKKILFILALFPLFVSAQTYTLDQLSDEITIDKLFEKSLRHGYFAFEDSSVAVNCVQNTWVQVTNATGDLFQGIQEGEGFDISGDTIYYNETAQEELHPHIYFAVGVDGFAGNQEDYEFRIYNIDNAEGVIRKFEVSGTGANNRVSAGTSVYDVKASFGDRYILQVINKTNSNDFTFENGSLYMKVSHY